MTPTEIPEAPLDDPTILTDTRYKPMGMPNGSDRDLREHPGAPAALTEIPEASLCVPTTVKEIRQAHLGVSTALQEIP